MHDDDSSTAGFHPSSHSTPLTPSLVTSVSFKAEANRACLLDAHVLLKRGDDATGHDDKTKYIAVTFYIYLPAKPPTF